MNSLFLRIFPVSHTQNAFFPSLGQNLVTWPHSAAKETGECASAGSGAPESLEEDEAQNGGVSQG